MKSVKAVRLVAYPTISQWRGLLVAINKTQMVSIKNYSGPAENWCRLNVSIPGINRRECRGEDVSVIWVPKNILMLCLNVLNNDLITAISSALEMASASCRYATKGSGVMTYEWHISRSEIRFRELQKDKSVIGLKKF